MELQKASLIKRLSALLLDIIVIMILATGFFWVLSMITGYDRTLDEYSVILNNAIDECETKYDVDLSISENDYLSLPDEERAVYDRAYDEINETEEITLLYEKLLMLQLTQVSIGLFLAFLVGEFIIPLFLKNGMTIGKKVFAIGVMRTDHVKASPVFLFVRAILGKYTLEVMFPGMAFYLSIRGMIGIVGPIIVAGLIGLQLICMIVTKTNSCIHDLLSNTVVVDFPTQRIFETPEARNAFKEG